MMKKTLASLTMLTLSAVAIAQPVIPPGYVSIYPAVGETELSPDTAYTQSSLKLLGPTSNWDKAIYDLTNYQVMEIKLRFHAADTGKQVALRFFANEALNANLVDLPKGTDTTHIIKLTLADYAGADGSVKFGGIWLYNGSTHFSFTYTGVPATETTIVEYVALKTIPAQGLAVVPKDSAQAKNLLLGLSTQLLAAFTPKNATNQSAIWSSADTNMATVDKNGLVTAKQLPGNVVILAKSVEDTSISGSYTIAITGNKVDVTGLSLAADTVKIKISFGGKVGYTILPANASLKTVTWMSSDVSIAQVDASGVITGVKEGYAKLTAATAGGVFKDSCVINVVGYRGIPAGYVSLYTLVYNDLGTLFKLDTITTYPSASIPGAISSDKGSLLGSEWNWNNPYRYCDVSPYSELVVGATFRKEDVGKDITFRYAFSSTADSEIANIDVAINQEEMQFVIDLDNDFADVEDLKRLGAIKFRSLSADLNFIVDYVALKTGTNNIRKFFPGYGIPESGLMAAYPAAKNGSFRVAFAQLPGSITVSDITGKVVLQKTVSHSFEEISLKQGLYFIRLESNGAYKFVRVVSTQ